MLIRVMIQFILDQQQQLIHPQHYLYIHPREVYRILLHYPMVVHHPVQKQAFHHPNYVHMTSLI